MYAVDPATGSVGNSLVSDTWRDAAGNVIKEQPAGSKRFTKRVYDGLARLIKVYTGYDDDDIKDIFVRMNKYVVKLSPQELRHAKAEGKFSEFVERLGK